MSPEDLSWLVAERPEPVSTDRLRARADLLDHIDAAGPRRRGPFAPARPLRVRIAASVGASAAVVAGVLALTGGHPALTHVRHPATATVHPAHHLANPRLLQLAGFVRDTAGQPGDATLVQRTQNYPDASSMTGADLYTDNGQYFYAETESGLPAAINSGDNISNGFTAREHDAAVYAANGDLAVARQRMANAAFDNGVPPKPLDAQGRAALVAQMRSLVGQAPASQRPALAKKLAGVESGQAADPHAQTDNEIWENSLDTMIAGAGDPQVRAGVLRILSTMSEVSVAQATVDGQPALVITAGPPALPSDYQEQLTINANTGVPLGFTGGTPGQTPGVKVAYVVNRVNVADIAAGRFPAQ